MKRIAPMIAALLLLVVFCHAQSQEFKPTSEPILRIFGNFHTGLTDADSKSLFEIERAYLGYATQVSPNLSAEVKIDIGSPENESVYAMVKRYAYIRNAFITYQKGSFSTNAGIIGMRHFSVQEKFWGYRYIQRVFADRYKFGQSIDIGVDANYTFNKELSIDAAIVNGEGYSQLQSDNYFEYCAGTTIIWPQQITWRFFTNIGPSATNTKMAYLIFAGINITKQWTLCGEYNLLQNNSYRNGYNQFGYSVYSTYKLPNQFKVFGRYDLSQSNTVVGTTNPWNLSKDGSSIIGGVEREVSKNLKLSLNYQDWYPQAKNLANKSYIYLNMEFKL